MLQVSQTEQANHTFVIIGELTKEEKEHVKRVGHIILADGQLHGTANYFFFNTFKNAMKHFGKKVVDCRVHILGDVPNQPVDLQHGNVRVTAVTLAREAP